MSEGLDEAVKKSTEILSKIIKKTPLTTKLLGKPPFRYLHDLFSEIIKQGYFVGLFNSTEMNHENCKKLIDCCVFATGVQVRLNPLKVVAGYEPEETNAFLQLVAKIVLKKVDTTDAVARVLRGENAKEYKPEKEDKVSAEPQQKAPVEIAKPATPEEDRQPKDMQPEEPVKPIEQKQVSETHVDPKKEKQDATEDKKTTKKQAQETTHSRSSTREKPTKEHSGKNNHVEKHEIEETTEEVEKEQPQRRTRPVTARHAPPRTKSAVAAAEEPARPVMAILTDGPHAEDDDEFVVKVTQVAKTLDSTISSNEQHGGLVKKILLSKKDDESKTPVTQKKITGVKEIEALKEEIQKLCQSITPFGKTMDYIQEDVDIMNKEYDLWKRESENYSMQLQDQSRYIDLIFELRTSASLL